MKLFISATLAFFLFVASHSTALGQVNNVRIVRHPRRVGRTIGDPAMKSAARGAHEAHLIMKGALPIYDGHRVLSMELCGLADRDIKEGLRGYPSGPQGNFAGRRPLKAHRNRGRAPRYSPAQIQASNAQMQRAIPVIQAAIRDLGQAAGDYGGYRTQAVASLNRALQEIQVCLQLRGGAGTIRP